MMKRYSIEEDKLILRDWLALERTILANERTFLAWSRTALSIIAAGLSFIKFFEIKLVSHLGYFLLPCGIITFFIGVYKFVKMQSKLNRR